MSAPGASTDPLSGLADWLAAAAQAHRPIDELHIHFCRRLGAAGLPIWRSSLALEVLHPEISGSQFIWTEESATTTDALRGGALESPSYLNSPDRIVDDTDRPFRQRLDQAAQNMPLLQELKDLGATDYLILPLPFMDKSRTAALSFATRKAGGFADSDLQGLSRAARIFGPYAERWVLRRLAIDLLDTYVGPRSGRRVFEGQIDRGEVERIDAAIWLADLRGFTRMSQAQTVESLLAALNDWLDIMVAAIDGQDGEVLKFMGDGVLAIFPCTEDGAEGACRRALDAARKFCDDGDALNAARAEGGQPPLDFGLGLHLGPVAYGNIGARRRLDFTVIGPAVNYASRIQDLTKTLGRRVLASAAFAAATDGTLRSLGSQALRDLEGGQDIFGF